MDYGTLVDIVTIAISLGGSYFLGRYGRKVNNAMQYIKVSDDGKHVHEFDHVYADGKWRCNVCEKVKDFE